MSFGYLYAISIHSVPLAILMSLLMWGVVYQGYNAVFPSFYPEMFPTRTRVSGMAISQNLGTLVSALLPALFVAVAPPGALDIPLTVGAITFAITAVAAIAATITSSCSSCRARRCMISTIDAATAMRRIGKFGNSPITGSRGTASSSAAEGMCVGFALSSSVGVPWRMYV